MSSTTNQQERLELEGWIVGFVDGEGCFCISINRNLTSKLGWQVMPEFVVTQGEKSLKTLKAIKKFFGCGRIFVNRRYDNHKENLWRYCVRSLKDLQEKVIPFFKRHPLKTSKKESFKYFVKVLELIKEKKHLNLSGIRQIPKLSQKINRQKIPKFLKSSETIRQSPPLADKI